MRKIKTVITLFTLGSAIAVGFQNCGSSVNGSTANASSVSKESTTGLAFNPNAVDVFVSQQTALTVVGGTPPYAFSVTYGLGTIAPGGGNDDSFAIFTASSTEGVTVVQVQDATGDTASATITVEVPANPVTPPTPFPQPTLTPNPSSANSCLVFAGAAVPNGGTLWHIGPPTCGEVWGGSPIYGYAMTANGLRYMGTSRRGHVIRFTAMTAAISN